MAKLKDNGPPAPQPHQPPRADARVRLAGVRAEDDEPELGGRQDGTMPPPLGDRPPFYICVHPKRWKVINGRVVPDVFRLRCTPGANAIDREQSTGKAIMSDALAQMVERGWQVLPWRVDGRSYLRRVKDTNLWHDRWTTLYSGTTEETFDTAGWVEWLTGLVERGVIQSPPLYELEKMRAKIDGRLQRAIERNRPDEAQRTERLKVDLAAIDREIEMAVHIAVEADDDVPEVA